MSEFTLPQHALAAAKIAYCSAGRTPDQKLEDAIRAFLEAAEPRATEFDANAGATALPSTQLRPLIDYMSDPAEHARHLEKMAQDYRQYFWCFSIASAARMIRKLLTDRGPPALPASDIVANHMRMSAGTVRMVYEGIREVVAAGGIAPAQKEAEVRREAAHAKDTPKILPRRGITATVAPAAPIARRPITAPAKPVSPTGFFES